VANGLRDHGIGIPPDRRSRIFERFYQAHADDHASGIGLGLYISRQIVGLHGGQLEAEFPPDGGTRFIVRLPSGRCP
jgi:signal transduction histidine kinase